MAKKFQSIEDRSRVQIAKKRTMARSSLLLATAVLVIIAVSLVGPTEASIDETKIKTFFQKGGSHTNNWAVLVSTSRFWFNYRHSANVLSLYRTVKRLGLTDDNIILMLADDFACDSRNSMAGTVFNHPDRKINLYGDKVEVDYRGYDVTVENFIRLLTGRHDPSLPRSKRLMSDSGSNILVFMTGHGGDQFIKFQDFEEISSGDLADAFGQMRIKNRYNEILFMADTCQATTLYERIYSDNFLAIGSAKRGENSLSLHADDLIGVSVIDRFTHATLEFFEQVQPDSNATIQDLFSRYNPRKLGSNMDWRTDLYERSLKKVYLTEFFGSETPVEVTSEAYPLF